MTVEQNVRYAGRERVGDLLERLGIAHLARAKPESLSGGERQRVGLARALARDPAVLLLDEPLSALDAHTRVTVRAELRELLEGFDLPTLLVTHDYEDAAALAGRIGVLVEGRLLQIGTPAELIAAPSDPFVASFTGGNLLRGEATLGAGGLTIVRLEDGTELASADEIYGAVGVIVYPWDVSLSHANRRLSTQPRHAGCDVDRARRQSRACPRRAAHRRADGALGRAARVRARRRGPRDVQGDGDSPRSAELSRSSTKRSAARGLEPPDVEHPVEFLGRSRRLREPRHDGSEHRSLPPQQLRSVGAAAREEEELQHERRAELADVRGRLGQPALELAATRPRRAEHRAPWACIAGLRSSLLDEAQLAKPLERPVHERARTTRHGRPHPQSERAGNCESVRGPLGEER